MPGLFSNQFESEARPPQGNAAAVKSADYGITQSDNGKVLFVDTDGIRGTLAASLTEGFEINVITGGGATTASFIQPPAGETMVIPNGLGVGTPGQGADEQAIQFTGAIKLKKVGSTWTVIGVLMGSLQLESDVPTLGSWSENDEQSIYSNDDSIEHPSGDTYIMLLRDAQSNPVDWVSSGLELRFNGEVLISGGQAQQPTPYQDGVTGIIFDNFNFVVGQTLFSWDWTGAIGSESGTLEVYDGQTLVFSNPVLVSVA